MRGRDPPLGVVSPNLLALAAARAVDVRVFVTFLIGIRDGVPASSVRSTSNHNTLNQGFTLDMTIFFEDRNLDPIETKSNKSIHIK